MSAPRSGKQCVECGNSCRITYVHRCANGTTTRRYVCDRGHAFTLNDSTQPRQYLARRPATKPAPSVPLLTAWRPYPFTDVSVLERAAL